MPTFKEYFGIKPKQSKQETNLPRRRYGTSPEDVVAEKAEIQERREKEMEEAKQKDKVRMEEARQKFQNEKPKLEQRLVKIPAEIAGLELELTEMKGPEIRRILDKEYQLNSSQSPIDSTDPNRRREYEMWVSALESSRVATQNMKANLGVRIDEYQRKISVLEKEKREAEQRIQRGY